MSALSSGGGQSTPGSGSSQKSMATTSERLGECGSLCLGTSLSTGFAVEVEAAQRVALAVERVDDHLAEPAVVRQAVFGRHAAAAQPLDHERHEPVVVALVSCPLDPRVVQLEAQPHPRMPGGTASPSLIGEVSTLCQMKYVISNCMKSMYDNNGINGMLFHPRG